MTFRYDDGLAASLGLSEEDLRVYDFTGGSWLHVTSGINTARHWIYADDITSFSMFAVGAVPEPSTLFSSFSLAVTGLVGYAWRRRFRQRSWPSGPRSVVGTD